MPTAIQSAREKVYAALQTLPAKGINNDFTLRIKRMQGDGAEPLSMDPNDSPSITTPLTFIVYGAPSIKAYESNIIEKTAFGGGVLKAGDHRLKLVRTAALEEFLSYNAGTQTNDWPYPQMSNFVFELNEVEYRTVHWVPETIFVKIYVRKIAQ